MAAKVQRWMQSGATAVVLLLSGYAEAQVVSTIHSGNNAGLTRKGQDGKERNGNELQAGIEQADILQLADGKIIAVGTSSYTDIDNVVTGQRGQGTKTRVQALCVSGNLTADNTFQVATMKHVTNNNGNEYRNANHTNAVPILNGKYAALYYNFQPNSDTIRYVTVVDSNCQTVMQQTQVLKKNNDNCSETGQNNMQVRNDSATATDVTSGDGCNGNGSDDSWIVNGRFTATGNGVSYQTLGDAVTTNQEERTRPDVVIDKTNRNIAYVTVSSGNTQPGNNGIIAYGFDVSGAQPRKLWAKTIEEYDEIDKKQRSVQATATQLANGNVSVNWYRVGQRTRRGKGRTIGQAQVWAFTPQGAQPVNETASYNNLMPGGDATHRAQIPLGNGSFALLSTSINGDPNAPSALQVVCDEGGALHRGPALGLERAVDSGWISQIYGNNPNNQGRNFVTGQMVMNMATNQPTFLIPATTRRIDPNTRMPEDKLAFEVIAVPGNQLACKNDANAPTVAWNGNVPGAGQQIPNTGVGADSSGVGGLGCQAGGSASLLLALAGLVTARMNRRRKAS